MELRNKRMSMLIDIQLLAFDFLEADIISYDHTYGDGELPDGWWTSTKTYETSAR